jgi:ABC-type glycerol-3-phosphate transport system substrate-binding protein
MVAAVIVVVLIIVGGVAYYAGTLTAPAADATTITQTVTSTSTTTVTATPTTTPTTTPGVEPIENYIEIPSEPITLQVATVGGSRFEFPMRELLPDFMQKYPWVKDVQFTVAEWEGTQARVAAELAARTGAFDVVHGGWESATPYFEGKFLVPLDDYINHPHPEIGIPDYREVYPSNIQELYSHEGVIWELGFDINCMMTYYREDVFQELGLKDPNTPGFSWEDAIDVAKTLKDNGYSTGRCMMRGTKVYEHYLTILWSLGGVTYDEKTFEPLMNTDIAMKALELDIELQKYAAPGTENWGDAEIADAFQTDKVHFAPGEWGGAASISCEENPKFCDVMGLASVPSGPGGKIWQCPTAGQGCFMGGAGYGIPLDAKWPDTSWLLMRYVQDLKPYPDDKTRRYLDKGAQPGRMSVLLDEGWQAEYPLLEGLSKCLPIACFKFGKLPEHPDMTMAFGTELHEAIFGGKDHKQAMNDAVEAWRDIFRKAGYISSVTPEVEVQEAEQPATQAVPDAPSTSPACMTTSATTVAMPSEKR